MTVTEKKPKEKKREEKANEVVSKEIETLRAELEKTRDEAGQVRDQLLRKAAEFENYKKRMNGEFRTLIDNANENLIFDLLPVLDDFERLLKSSHGQETGENSTAILKGFELIHSKLKSLLSQRGLEPFDSVGKDFDVEFHDAFLQVPKNDVPPNTVIEEVNRGYRLNEKILRHAKVVVSAPVDSPEKTDAQAGTGPSGEKES